MAAEGFLLLKRARYYHLSNGILWTTADGRWGAVRVPRLLLCLCVVALPFSIGGCYDRKELEQQAFVTIMGVDAAPNGLIDVTFEVAAPQAPGGGGGANAQSESRGPEVTVRARTLSDALTTANSSIERTLSLTHLTLILFGESLAAKGLIDIAQSVSRYRQFRGTTLVGVSTGTAQATLKAFQPMLEKSPSRAAESVTLVGKEQGVLPNTFLHDFLRTLELHHTSLLVPMFAVNQAVENDSKGESGIPEQQLPKTEVGRLARAGGNPVEWGGAAVFRGDKMVDVLNGEEMRCVAIVSAKLKRTSMNFQDPVNPQDNVGISVRGESRPVYQVTFGKPLRIDVYVPLEADVLNTENTVDYSSSEMRQRLQQSVEKQLGGEIKTLLTRLLVQDQADVIPISNTIRHRFPTHRAFANYPWEHNLKDVKISVKLDVNIRRYGIQMIPLKENVN